MSYVSHIPEDRTHQRVVLDAEILVTEGPQQQESPGSSLEEPVGDGLGVHPAGNSYRGHRSSPVRLTTRTAGGGRFHDMIWLIRRLREGRHLPPDNTGTQAG